MLKRSKFILLLLALCTGSLFAYPHPCPGSWTVEADYLYLFPTIDDTYFVLVNSTPGGLPNGARKKNDFHFRSGFRVGGAYAFCDCDRDFQIYYTRLYANQSKTVTGSGLFADTPNANLAAVFQNYTGSASSRISLLYQRVDGFVDQQILCLCGLNIYLQGGFEYAYLRLNESYAYQIDAGNPGRFQAKSKTWGIGPQLGLETDYNLCQVCSFLPGTMSLVACTSGSLLLSNVKRDSFASNIAGVTIFNVRDDETWRFIPAFHAHLGLNYAMCFSCFNANLEIGYEFNTYIRGLKRITNSSTAALAIQTTSYFNFDVQGLYVNFDFTF